MGTASEAAPSVVDGRECLREVMEGRIREMSMDSIRAAMRYVGMEEGSVEVVEGGREDKELGDVIIELLKECVGVKGEEEEEVKKDPSTSRNILRLVVNLANRSHRIRHSIPREALSSLLQLFHCRDVHLELAALLTAFAFPLHMACSLCVDYDALLAGAAHLWVSTECDSTRSWFSAFFSILLEKDASFLANAFGDLPPSSFTALLHVVDALMSEQEEKKSMIHQNNVQFIVDLLERIIFDFGEEEERTSDRMKEYCEQLPIIMEIVGSAALCRSAYWEQLHSKTVATTTTVRLLHTCLHAEGSLPRRPRLVKRANDRPEEVSAFRSGIVESSPALERLAIDIVTMEEEEEKRMRSRLAAFKSSLVRAIGNLVCESALNRVKAGEEDAVIVCLVATKKGEDDEPFLTQWSIVALRHLCLGCPENQERLAAIESTPTGIVDRDNLLAEMGLRVENGMDEEGKRRVRLVNVREKTTRDSGEKDR